MEEFSTLFTTAPITIKTNRFLSVGINGVELSTSISTQTLENQRFRFIEFENADAALKWIKGSKQTEKKRAIEAVLCNLELLKNESFSFVKAIQSDPELSIIPIIAFASPNQKLDKSQILKEGIDDCYTFPIDWNTLLQRVEYLKSNKQKIQQTVHESGIPGLDFPFSKRILDVFIAGLAILIFSPLFLLIAIIIKLESKGPVIYISKRVGAGYQIFDFYKFRSMVKDADSKLQNLSHKNQYINGKGAQSVSFVKIKNDPRVTRFGRFLRKTSIDELPQLFNVLKGDMSVVGNRPLPLYEARQLVQNDHVQRFFAPAGLTGLWQVTKRGKGDMSSAERIALDIEYANTYSFWGDLRIISKTIPAMIQEESV